MREEARMVKSGGGEYDEILSGNADPYITEMATARR
jgi:hypothetical protein